MKVLECKMNPINSKLVDSLRVAVKKYELFSFVSFILISMSFGWTSFAEEIPFDLSCECEQSKCGVCEMETGTTFYSAKCGPGGSQVKSCKKPTCSPVENQKECFALLQPEEVHSSQVENTQEDSRENREPSSMRQVTSSGVVVQVLGQVTLQRMGARAEKVSVKMPVYEGDTLVTESEGRVQVAMNDGSEVILSPNSKVKIDEARVIEPKDEANGKPAVATGQDKVRQITLNLLLGRVRSKVVRKTNEENHFRVRTKSAVAGVRGTEFVASIESGANDKGELEWNTKVHTFEGKVALGGLFPKADGKTPEVDVPAGTYAAFIMKDPGVGANEDEFKKIASDGFITPAFSMTSEEMELLKDATDMTPTEALNDQLSKIGRRHIASASNDPEAVCLSPLGKFNQCSWTCEGNPASNKKCRVDLPGVSCVRRLCRANGQWAEPKRMPANQSDLCDADKVIVRDCGNYW